MRQLQAIAAERTGMHVIQTLTFAFEGLASTRISQIKNQVARSDQFFNELWLMYSQIRVDNLFRFGRRGEEDTIPKQLFIAITSEGGFSGDIDLRLVREMLAAYDPARHDIVIIGKHGAQQLRQAGVRYVKYFNLPKQDHSINVAPLVAEVRRYESTVVYYQSYASLSQQSVQRIDLAAAVKTAGHRITQQENDISEATYIFEPNSFAVAAHLERSIVDITLSQVILDSKLAQYASRFRAMRTAHDRASRTSSELDMAYSRTRRGISDERLKEIVNGLMKSRAAS